MARTTETILKQMDDAQIAESSLNSLNSPSQSAIYRLWKYITAQVMQFFEQLVDLKKDELNKVVAKSAVPSDAWLKAKVLEFQYDATTPQTIQLIDHVPTYNPIDASKRIISRCSVKTTGARIVTVKVAAGEPPVKLSNPQLNSLKGYLTNGSTSGTTGVGAGIGFAGIQLIPISNDPDRMYIQAEIIYNGQFAATIPSDVKAAIGNYLKAVSSLENFDGSIKVLDVVDYLQAVPGVYDIKIRNLALMPYNSSILNASYLIKEFKQELTEYPTYAGYAVVETATGFTLNDSLTFTAR